MIVVTCILSKGGYREENSLPGPADTSGSKNPIQAIGSTVTYLERITLKAALGLSATDDDDGNSAGRNGGPQSSDEFYVTPEQVAELERLLALTGRSVELFCKKFYLAEIGHLPASKYDLAVNFLNQFIPKAK
jgi:hypothetical protein